MKRTQPWQQDPGTFFAVNKQRRLTYRRTAGGEWQQAEMVTKAVLTSAEQVGWDKIEGGWFAVYRAS